MGVPTSEVGYNSATARRRDHESSYEHVVGLEGKKSLKDIWCEDVEWINMVRYTVG